MTEAPQPRMQNFIIETSGHMPTNSGESSKAIVQSLLTSNENVSTQLSRLLGQKHKAKNQSLVTDSSQLPDESSVSINKS